jgi:SAM-dependent methyltransferase
MTHPAPFDRHADEYDRWFDENGRVYQAEVHALRRLVPAKGRGLEIGVGTGRFAAPLGIATGIDPAAAMLRIAKERHISVCQAVGETLPFRDGAFDFALLVTVLCFVEDPAPLLREAIRVVKPGGHVIVGFIDKDTALGKLYESRKDTNKFYQNARFYSAPQVAALLLGAGLRELRFSQTIFGVSDHDAAAYDIRDGHGDGAFVVASTAAPSSLNPRPK